MLQFARPQPWLAGVPILDQRNDLAIPCLPGLPAILLLVVCLAADADMAASPGNAQSGDSFLREDLPEGFFAMLIP